jgi:hypothetical protein
LARCHSGCGARQPPAPVATSGMPASSSARSTGRPRAALARASSAPPRSHTTASTRRRSALRWVSTSSHRYWPLRSPSTLASSSAMAGQPPVCSRRATSTPLRSAKPTSSSPEKRRPSSVTRAQAPLAARRVTGMGRAWREASSRCPFWGRASTKPPSQAAPGEPGGSRWTLSRTRHTGRGARAHTASATARGPGAADAVPAGRGTPRATWRSVRPVGVPSTAARASWASVSPSASLCWRPSQTSSPRGARRFSAMAWASSVVLPRPAPPITDVTRCSQRASSARRRRGRVMDPRRGSGGSNRNE